MDSNRLRGCSEAGVPLPQTKSSNTPMLRFCLALAVLVAAGGCSRGPKLVPVRGQVFYRDQPLKFGSVMFQPESGGQPARATIEPDGTFTLTTYRNGKSKPGAVVGKHLVRITCYEGQRAAATGKPTGETYLGRLLIPERYTRFDEDGLTAEVREGSDEPIIFRLSDD